jgi:hypothetical protein
MRYKPNDPSQADPVPTSFLMEEEGVITCLQLPLPLGNQLTKNMIQADLTAKALDPSKTTTRPNASKFNVFANFGEIKGESPDKDHRD